jgi:hypothetical protein
MWKTATSMKNRAFTAATCEHGPKIARYGGGAVSSEVPYQKLDDIAKITASLCALSGPGETFGRKDRRVLHGRGESVPMRHPRHPTNGLDGLMRECYDTARYGETTSAQQERGRLEEELLKEKSDRK